MFSSVTRFFNNHQRKFIIGGIIVSGVVILSRYSRTKLQDWRQREVQELLQRSRRSGHFESTERSCNQTIMNLAICVRNSITKSLDTEKVINGLKNGTTGKISAWNKLKVFSISRTATIIYANTMLVATLRIQLSLMGAYMFKNSQNTFENGPLDEAIQQKYLTLCSYFINDGIQKLCSFIEKKVADTVDSIDLAAKLSIRDLEQIYLAILSTVLADKSNDPVKNLVSYMLPSNVDQEDNELLKKIINQTLDLLESEEIQNLMQSDIRTGFVMLVDKISEYFVDIPIEKNGIQRFDGNCGFLDVHKLTMPMAKIIPIINGQVPDVPTANDVPTEWLQRLIMDDGLKSFGANVYEAFSF